MGEEEEEGVVMDTPGTLEKKYRYREILLQEIAKGVLNKVVFISNGCFVGEDSLLTDRPLWPSCKCISGRRALIFYLKL